MKKSSFSIFKYIALLITAIFGRLTWKSPPWIPYLRRKAHRSPFSFWSASVAVLFCLFAFCYGLYWYSHLPQPLYITANIEVPNITPNEEELVPNPLIINFGLQKNGFIPQSVAPLSQMGKSLKDGIQLSPQMAGTWKWENDNQLIFTPSEDWPAGQSYTIHFDRQFFTAHAAIKTYDLSFKTKPFTAKISQLQLYQDPLKADFKQAVATIEFNYPVDKTSLEKNTSLVFQTIEKHKSSNEASPSYSYTYDKNGRVAYLHSSNIHLANTARYLLLTLTKNLQSSTQSDHLQQDISKNLLIPDASNFLKVISATASIVRNKQDRPEQILSVETSLGINEHDFAKAVHIYVLPNDLPANASQGSMPIRNYHWENPGEVNAAILALATPLMKETLPTAENYSSLHSYNFNLTGSRYLYLKIDKGMTGFGGYRLSEDYRAIIPVPELPQEISFLHTGSLLALNGEKKLSILIRGLPAVKFDFARVLPDNINQLVSQTQGDFNNPYFFNPSFNQQNISQISSEVRRFDSDLTKQQYTALDFNHYLEPHINGNGPHGLFLLQATGWNPQLEVPLEAKASRLILITDLGMLVKDNADGSHIVYINSITSGLPVANASLSILGKNGLTLMTQITDAEGKASFPNLRDFTEDKEPTVYLAQLGDDVSFIPYNNYNRQLNFSKFDIGGIYTNNEDPHHLSAYLFSDRGIYRPGDTAHIAMIVKQAFAQPQPPGLPLQISVYDPRGNIIKEEQIVLNESGYSDLNIATQPSSPTGQYTVNLFLVKDNHPSNLLGSTSIRIAEFEPDRMRIQSTLSPSSTDGWLSPVNLKAKIRLVNLYGAVAANRKVSAKIILAPQKISFDAYPDYVFADPLFDSKKAPKVLTETLTDTKTNDKGQAEFALHLEQYNKGTYQLTFFAEGFEADSGRSVATQSTALVSPLSYFIGYKTDGDLSFIKQNSQRHVHFIAINPQLTEEAVPNLTAQLLVQQPVTSLVKAKDGTYKYQSIVQSKLVNSTPMTLSEQGINYALPTQEIGNYLLNIIDDQQTILSQLSFSIVGSSQLPLAKNAELTIKLDKENYVVGEDIHLQVTAPYAGSGLITIERDKVYATQWFKASTPNSMQSIHIPADFQGNGYVNVAFIRDWDSPELFISPLSYSVVPFSVNHEQQEMKISLKSPQLAKPGETLVINYKADKPGKIILFAVDEGILQVARYQSPDPLAFFFQKHALEVITQQTVDQILPKFIQDRELSAVGGDGSDENLAHYLNPFKRKTDLPVAFWSGILPVDTNERQVSYTIPSYFNGTLKIMAVAVAADSLGATESFTKIRGDFVINPNVPPFVAPNDEFEITASVANNVRDSGLHLPVKVTINTSPELTVIGKTEQISEIREGQEGVIHFTLRANALLGSGKITLTARAQDKSSYIDSSISVRPASVLSTQLTSGQTQDKSNPLPIRQDLYPQYRQVDAIFSTNPLILVFGLEQYLANFPYGCTEQLVSKAMPLLVMNELPPFAEAKQDILQKITKTIEMLGQRQMTSGLFSYWPGLGENNANPFATVYAMHFLTKAKAAGFTVPSTLFSAGINALKDIASQNAADLEKARIQAYAIYILTRNELITTNYLTNLQLSLGTTPWQKDITGSYVAATYKLLKNVEEAYRLIDLYTPSTNSPVDNDFFTQTSNNAQYLYLIAKHFPKRLPKANEHYLMTLISAMNNNEINTLQSAYTSLALGAYPLNSSSTLSSLTITALLNNNQQQMAMPEDFQPLKVDDQVKQLIVNNPKGLSYFYQLSQSGFTRALSTQALSQGIDIVRNYQDSEGKDISSVSLGQEIVVHLRIRALNNLYLSHVAIEDLLPGGFEVVRDSIKADQVEFVDVREDRVNFFCSIGDNAKELTYKIKAINHGKFTLPAAYAQSMYNPGLQGQSSSSSITVAEE